MLGQSKIPLSIQDLKILVGGNTYTGGRWSHPEKKVNDYLLLPRDTTVQICEMDMMDIKGKQWTKWVMLEYNLAKDSAYMNIKRLSLEQPT